MLTTLYKVQKWLQLIDATGCYFTSHKEPQHKQDIVSYPLILLKSPLILIPSSHLHRFSLLYHLCGKWCKAKGGDGKRKVLGSDCFAQRKSGSCVLRGKKIALLGWLGFFA